MKHCEFPGSTLRSTVPMAMAILSGAMSIAFATGVQAEPNRRPMVQADLAEPYASAIEYPTPEGRDEADGPSRIMSPDSAAALTVDPKSRRYTYWYTLDDQRQTMSFTLANRIDLVVRASVTVVDTANDNESGNLVYRYRYVLERDPESPEGLRYFVFQMNPEHVTWGPEVVNGRNHPDWRVLENRRLRRVGLSIKGRPGSGKDRYEVSFTSEHGPRVINIAAQSHFTSAHHVPGVSKDYFALGLSGNSVLGQTIGPSHEPLPPPHEALRRTLVVAERWHWLSEQTLKDMREKIEKAQHDDVELPDLLRQLRNDALVAPEVVALIDEIKRQIEE